MSGHPTRAEVDLAAVTTNVERLAALVAPAAVCVVVKADAYGHGAVPVAEAALAGGASRLAVAHPKEAAALRQSGVEAPILLLSEPRPEALPEVVALGLEVAVYTEAGIEAADAAATARGVRLAVHLKVDTGMHRVGAAPEHAVDRALQVQGADGLVLAGTWTHCAVADEPDDPFTAEQVRRFDEVLAAFADAGVDPGVVHQANSPAALAHPATRRDLVRLGIAAYGIPPSPALAEQARAMGLRPALRLLSEVTHVHAVAAGEGVSYGRRHHVERPTRLATVPIGYADGVPRAFGLVGGEVLVGGRRRPVRGVVTMDQLVVEVGDDPVAVGDEVVLLGRQGDQEVTALEWAERLDTIGYEVVTRIGPRVPRAHSS